MRGALSASATVAGRSALSRLIIGNGASSASSAGGSVIANRLGLSFFRKFAKRCRGGKSDLCQYAKGFILAHAKVGALVAITPNARLKQGSPNRAIIVSGAFDFKKGVASAAFNGAFNSRSISSSIVSKIQKHGFKLGVRFSCLDSRRQRTTGRCAEVHAANSLLKKKGAKLKNIRWIDARFVDPGSNGFGKLGNVVRACAACQTLTGD